jgi:hypothetical protein
MGGIAGKPGGLGKAALEPVQSSVKHLNESADFTAAEEQSLVKCFG